MTFAVKEFCIASNAIPAKTWIFAFFCDVISLNVFSCLHKESIPQPHPHPVFWYGEGDFFFAYGGKRFAFFLFAGFLLCGFFCLDLGEQVAGVFAGSIVEFAFYRCLQDGAAQVVRQLWGAHLFVLRCQVDAYQGADGCQLCVYAFVQAAAGLLVVADGVCGA